MSWSILETRDLPDGDVLTAEYDLRFLRGWRWRIRRLSGTRAEVVATGGGGDAALVSFHARHVLKKYDSELERRLRLADTRAEVAP